MNDLTVFQHPEFGRLRTVIINSEPWWAGKDVAQALGYKNTKDAIIAHVDNDDRQIIERSKITTIENHIPKSAFPVDFVGADIPNRGLTFINESGLYSLILSSKLPSAKRFKHWVTSEVLPQIRKTGQYTHAQAATPISTDDYIRAAGIVARCTDQRLPIVLNLLEKGGFSVQRLNNRCLMPSEQGDKITPEDLAHLQAVLSGYTVRQAARLVDLSPGIISYYRRGLRSPDYERYKRILEILE